MSITAADLARGRRGAEVPIVADVAAALRPIGRVVPAVCADARKMMARVAVPVACARDARLGRPGAHVPEKVIGTNVAVVAGGVVLTIVAHARCSMARRRVAVARAGRARHVRRSIAEESRLAHFTAFADGVVFTVEADALRVAGQGV